MSDKEFTMGALIDASTMKIFATSQVLLLKATGSRLGSAAGAGAFSGVSNRLLNDARELHISSPRQYAASAIAGGAFGLAAEGANLAFGKPAGPKGLEAKVAVPGESEAAIARAAAERDALGKELGRRYAVYTGGAKEGQTAVGHSSKAFGCAENDVARQLGPDAQFTKAYGWRRDPSTGKLAWEEIPVCHSCQGTYSPGQFPPDVQSLPGGPWSRR
jgi:hypothetical protein